MASNLIYRTLNWVASRRFLKYLLFGAIALVTALFLGLAIFNWRQERLWQAVVAQHRAHGEPVELKDVVPASVPDDQNFAMTPLLAPLYAFDPKIPGDFGNGSAERNQLISGKILRTTAERRPKGGSKLMAPAMGNWRIGELTDLAAWQDYYSADDTFAHPAKPGRPGVDILAALAESNDQIAELEAASLRPHAVFKVHYDTENPAAILLPHLAVLKRFNAYCVLSGIAALSEGNSAMAAARARVGFRLVRAMDQEPILISYLVQVAMWHQLTQLIWEGAARHAWTPDQLEALQREVDEVHPARGAIKSMRGERAFGNAIYERWIHAPRQMAKETDGMWANDSGAPQGWGAGIWNAAFLVPRGVFRMNQRLQHSIASRSIDGMRSLETSPGVYHLPAGNLPAFLEEGPDFGPTTPGNALAKMFAPAMQKLMQKALAAEASQRVVAAGIALERSFQARKEYPANLDALSPQWTPQAIIDPFSGKPLRYRRESAQRMAVYSVGWDLQDAGGAWPLSEKDLENASPAKRNTPSQKKGAIDDLVWGSPKE
ncbi:MAG: hypothetical protein HYR88_05675 [Verrucomicrobia bacterium]|nr:hypothetical protein [Verrucomicrobiota bacterium]MBI3870348.1 hypothetical protein [Verrucomicrobiota bacterium]